MTMLFTVLFIVLLAANAFCCGMNIWAYMQRGNKSKLYIGIVNGLVALFMLFTIIARG